MPFASVASLIQLGIYRSAGGGPPLTPPIVVVPPVISSPDLNVGTTATMIPAVFAGIGFPGVDTQWYWSDTVPASDIPGATGLTYTFATSDVGHTVSGRQTATNAAGSAVGRSNGLGPITQGAVTYSYGNDGTGSQPPGSIAVANAADLTNKLSTATAGAIYYLAPGDYTAALGSLSNKNYGTGAGITIYGQTGVTVKQLGWTNCVGINLKYVTVTYTAVADKPTINAMVTPTRCQNISFQNVTVQGPPDCSGTVSLGDQTSSGAAGIYATITGSTGTVNIGAQLLGAFTPNGTTSVITNFVSGVSGGDGVYQVRNFGVVFSGKTLQIGSAQVTNCGINTAGTLVMNSPAGTTSVITGGPINVGDPVSEVNGTGVTAGTFISAYGTGTGGIGNYSLNVNLFMTPQANTGILYRSVGINVLGGTQITIDKCQLNRVTGGIKSTLNSGALARPSFLTVTNNRVNRWIGDCVLLQSSDNVIVRRNVLYLQDFPTGSSHPDLCQLTGCGLADGNGQLFDAATGRNYYMIVELNNAQWLTTDNTTSRIPPQSVGFTSGCNSFLMRNNCTFGGANQGQQIAAGTDGTSLVNFMQGINGTSGGTSVPIYVREAFSNAMVLGNYASTFTNISPDGKYGPTTGINMPPTIGTGSPVNIAINAAASDTDTGSTTTPGTRDWFVFTYSLPPISLAA